MVVVVVAVAVVAVAVVVAAIVAAVVVAVVVVVVVVMVLYAFANAFANVCPVGARKTIRTVDLTRERSSRWRYHLEKNISANRPQTRRVNLD